MNVVLKVTSTTTYDVYFDEVDSIEDAKNRFEDRDLDDATVVQQDTTVVDAVEVVECEECGGWGKTYPSEDNIFVRLCEPCNGNGWIVT